MTDETIRRITDAPSPPNPPNGWFPSLLARNSEFSTETLLALEVDTRHVVDCFIKRLTCDDAPLVSGLVLGAVQSGKTGSMLAVSSLAIDHGFDVVVLVSGTRVSLWRQTLDRSVRDLDGWDVGSDFQRRQVRLWLPETAYITNGRFNPGEMFDVSVNRMTKNIRAGNPIVAVVMKQADHLSALRESLHRAMVTIDRPLKMLVIDDEADDGSILGAGPVGAPADRFLPRWIEGLWARGPSDSRVFHDKLRVVYLAYTATPQANLLQHDHNPLSPRDFVTCIRAPGASGSPEIRDRASFAVPLISQRHSGGGEFYPAVAELFQPCIGLENADGLTRAEWEVRRMELVGESLRAFIVATACRLIASSRSYVATRGVVVSTLTEAKAIMPPISSMLFNPSSSVESQFEGELVVKSWVHDESPHIPPIVGVGADVARPEVEWHRLAVRITRERNMWSAWLTAYRRSAEILRARPGCAGIQLPPEDWEIVERAIVEEVLPSIQMQVVNGSLGADAPPNFEPMLQADGTWCLPTSLCTIFVAGNIMSRGLTLEGLSTTLFLRDPDAPLADTQMQMQRWFGYRGAWLAYCRVFAFEDQLDRFRQYHAADEALRTEIINIERAKAGSDAGGVSPQVLGGRNFLPTGKVENLRRLPLAPGGTPFISGFWDGSGVDPNFEMVEQRFAPGNADGVTVGIKRGLILKTKYSLSEVADMLDEMIFVDHDPTPSADEHHRWESIERALKLDPAQNFLFRPGLEATRRGGDSRDKFLPTKCPYSIAAYFRLWALCREHAGIGLYPNDKPEVPWGHLSPGERARRCPRFSIGLRFGQGPVVAGTSLDRVGTDLGNDWRIRLMEREIDEVRSQLVATWGTRNPTGGPGAYFGDQFFDYHRTGLNRNPPRINIDDAPWRAIGEDGLILFHLLAHPSGHPRLAIGVCLPAGGPDQIGVLRPVQH
ncbi:MAG: Z1 domain-containing protein [Planctomycetes bacterium]|nr:Z1 domain-containing protein [Planctomycetota bacterium]